MWTKKRMADIGHCYIVYSSSFLVWFWKSIPNTVIQTPSFKHRWSLCRNTCRRVALPPVQAHNYFDDRLHLRNTLGSGWLLHLRSSRDSWHGEAPSLQVTGDIPCWIILAVNLEYQGLESLLHQWNGHLLFCDQSHGLRILAAQISPLLCRKLHLNPRAWYFLVRWWRCWGGLSISR